MAQDRTGLPEGTDTIIAGASRETPAGGDSAGSRQGSSALQTSGSGGSQSSGGSNRMIDKVRTGGEKLSGQAADKARGLVGQGLERSSEAIASVSKMIGDTAAGLDERLGEEYGDYARKAASTLESTANNLASKNPDELIEDTRGFVRKSPGVALAGAAIVGFALARLIKTGLSSGSGEDDDRSDGQGSGSRGGSSKA